MTSPKDIGLIDLGKAAIGFVASLVWIAIAVRFVSDTQAGVVALAGPFFVIVGASAYFFARGLGRLLGRLLRGDD